MENIRIFNKILPEKKKVYIALTEIYGIGINNSINICKKIGLPLNLKVYELQRDQVDNIIKLLKEKNNELENNLKQEIQNNINIYIKNKSLRGFRHKKFLPVRGQRTHSNARTRTKWLRKNKKVK